MVIIPRGFAEAHGIEESENIILSDFLDCGGIRIEKDLLKIEIPSKHFLFSDPFLVDPELPDNDEPEEV